MKKIYVLFSVIDPFPPKTYKTLKWVKKLTQQNTNLLYKQFALPEEAKSFIQKLQKNNALLASSLFEKENAKKKISQQMKDINDNNDNKQIQEESFKQMYKKAQQRLEKLKSHQQFQKQMKKFTLSKPRDFFKYKGSLIYQAFTDGSSKGNPGKSSIGYLIKQQGTKKIIQRSQFIGYGTNNRAQFTALAWCLTDAYCYGILKLRVYSDSEFMCKLINKECNTKISILSQLADYIFMISEKFQFFKIGFIPRNLNTQADKLTEKSYHATKKANLLT